MPEARIEYREGGSGSPELWAIRVGTAKEIEASARGLLEDLREEHSRSQVYIVDGRGRRRRVQLLNGRPPRKATPEENGGDEGTPAAAFSETFESPLA